ncbi:MAG: thiamine-phosphate kinase [Planctomycetia bacterium]|nr:thiamine-phosphate kinase [Planctomycetia bacterium]
MELEIVERLCRRFPSHPALKLGPGDDAAILELAGRSPEIVVTTDMLTEGVDYFLERAGGRKIGRKALAVNLSDLAAMAAEPVGCVIAVALPQRGDVPKLMEDLCEGFLDAARETPLAIAGGDTNTWKGPLVISVTAIGRVVGKPLCRRGAKPGDAIFVTGPLGGSILRHQFDFTPRVREMAILRDFCPLHAGMDISDGLTLDLFRLTQQSRCGAILDLDRIPISPDAVELSELKTAESDMFDWIPQKFASRSPLEHALGDGEDFEILFTVSRASAAKLEKHPPQGVSLTRIGEITSTPGILGRFQGNEPFPLKISGFEHT